MPRSTALLWPWKASLFSTFDRFLRYFRPLWGGVCVCVVLCLQCLLLYVYVYMTVYYQDRTIIYFERVKILQIHVGNGYLPWHNMPKQSQFSIKPNQIYRIWRCNHIWYHASLLDVHRCSTYICKLHVTDKYPPERIPLNASLPFQSFVVKILVHGGLSAWANGALEVIDNLFVMLLKAGLYPRTKLRPVYPVSWIAHSSHLPLQEEAECVPIGCLWAVYIYFYLPVIKVFSLVKDTGGKYFQIPSLFPSRMVLLHLVSSSYNKHKGTRCDIGSGGRGQLLTVISQMLLFCFRLHTASSRWQDLFSSCGVMHFYVHALSVLGLWWNRGGKKETAKTPDCRWSEQLVKNFSGRVSMEPSPCQ